MKNDNVFPYNKKIGVTSSCPDGTGIIEHPGMSKRFYAACAAMQGIVSDAVTIESTGRVGEEEGLSYEAIIVKKAYQLADELLKQEGDD